MINAKHKHAPLPGAIAYVSMLLHILIIHIVYNTLHYYIHTSTTTLCCIILLNYFLYFFAFLITAETLQIKFGILMRGKNEKILPSCVAIERCRDLHRF